MNMDGPALDKTRIYFLLLAVEKSPQIFGIYAQEGLRDTLTDWGYIRPLLDHPEDGMKLTGQGYGVVADIRLGKSVEFPPVCVCPVCPSCEKQILTLDHICPIRLRELG